MIRGPFNPAAHLELAFPPFNTQCTITNNHGREKLESGRSNSGTECTKSFVVDKWKFSHSRMPSQLYIWANPEKKCKMDEKIENSRTCRQKYYRSTLFRKTFEYKSQIIVIIISNFCLIVQHCSHSCK